MVNAVVVPFVSPNGSAMLRAVSSAPRGILVTVAGWVTLVFADP